MHILVGTRGSKLALTQTNTIVAALKSLDERHSYEVKIITTKGDINHHVPLSQVGGSGLFVKEIEQALLLGEIDLAIHSLKDMPSNLPEGLMLADFPQRENPGDVLITKLPITSIKELPQGAVIGTGSLRRLFQLKQIRPDLNFTPIRGNIDSRINKIGDTVDGIILAQSGVNRLGVNQLEDYFYVPFTLDEMIPSPCQGILGIELRTEGNHKEVLVPLLKQLSDPTTCYQALAERAFLKTVGSNCHIPIGGFCQINGDNVSFYGLLGQENGDGLMRKMVTCTLAEATHCSQQLAEELMKEVGL
jgi:hydroxymethylbilane synthase